MLSHEEGGCIYAHNGHSLPYLSARRPWTLPQAQNKENTHHMTRMYRRPITAKGPERETTRAYTATSTAHQAPLPYLGCRRAGSQKSRVPKERQHHRPRKKHTNGNPRARKKSTPMDGN